MIKSKRFNPKSYEANMLKRQIENWEFDLKAIENVLDKEKCISIYDSQYRNAEIVKTIENAIDEGYTISLLPEFEDGIKDINEWVIHNKGDVKDVLDIINNNIYKGLKAKIKLAGLRKV